jgi:hypothetical protein
MREKVINAYVMLQYDWSGYVRTGWNARNQARIGQDM